MLFCFLNGTIGKRTIGIAYKEQFDVRELRIINNTEKKYLSLLNH
jgi:hypothetical protein